MPTTIALVRPTQSFTLKKEVATGAVLVAWAIALLLFNVMVTVDFPARDDRPGVQNWDTRASDAGDRPRRRRGAR